MRKVAKTNIKEKLRRILRRIGFAICVTAFVCFVLFSVHAFRIGLIQQKVQDVQAFWWNSLQRIGFDLPTKNSILIVGRERTEKDAVKKIIDAESIAVDYQILRLDLKKIQRNLKSLPWVKEVNVKRQLPNMLYVSLKERKPIALFKDKNGYYPIDEEGTIVYIKEDGNIEEQIIIVGKGSVKECPSLIKELDAYPRIKERVMGAKLIGERRWQLFIDDLENGVVVDLPDAPLSKGLARLDVENNQHGILNKQAKRIDLRLDDRAVIVPLTSDSILRPFSSMLFCEFG